MKRYIRSAVDTSVSERRKKKTSIPDTQEVAAFEKELPDLVIHGIDAVNDADINWEYNTPKKFSNAVFNYMLDRSEDYAEEYGIEEDVVIQILQNNKEQILHDSSLGDFSV